MFVSASAPTVSIDVWAFTAATPAVVTGDDVGIDLLVGPETDLEVLGREELSFAPVDV